MFQAISICINNEIILIKLFLQLIRDLEVANIRLCAVHMIDSLYCPDPASYISVVMSSLSAMVGLEMPHVGAFHELDVSCS